MRKGDLVLAYANRNRIAYVGEVSEEYKEPNETNSTGKYGYLNQVKVNWWKEPHYFLRTDLPDWIRKQLGKPYQAITQVWLENHSFQGAANAIKTSAKSESPEAIEAFREPPRKTTRKAQAIHFQPEFEGKRSPYRISDVIQAEVKHGLVIRALRDQIRRAGYNAGSSRSRDLFAVGPEGTTVALFEAKTSYELSDVYSAIGQLCYNADSSEKCKLIAVLPEGTPKRILSRLGQLGILNLTYFMDPKKVQFRNLQRILT